MTITANAPHHQRPAAWHCNTTLTDDGIVDDVAIDYALAGRRDIRLTDTERWHAVQRGLRRGMSLNAISKALRISHRIATQISEQPPPGTQAMAASAA